MPRHRFWRLLGRILFWSYERGSLPYDLAVLAILAFVLLSPRRWFHDQPDSGPPTATSAITFVGQQAGDGRRIYRLDPSLLAPARYTPELERQVHQALQQNVADLHGRTFEIVQIQPELASDGSVRAYLVTIKPSR